MTELNDFEKTALNKKYGFSSILKRLHPRMSNS
jgi:hypothetical protein